MVWGKKKKPTKYHAVVANKIIYRLISECTYVYFIIMYYRKKMNI